MQKEWQVLDEERGILWREYKFAKHATATTLAFRGTDGSMVVISPPADFTERDVEVLSKHGEVRALIANNDHHALGQGPSRALLKNAKSYGTSTALPRLRKKGGGLDYLDVRDLALPDYAKICPLPASKNGEIFALIRTKKGALWYTGDILVNLQDTPPAPIKWLFTLTDSAPGFRLFKLAVWMFVSDRKAMRAGIEAMFAEDPPAIIVPAHGPPVTAGDLSIQVKRELARL